MTFILMFPPQVVHQKRDHHSDHSTIHESGGFSETAKESQGRLLQKMRLVTIPREHSHWKVALSTLQPYRMTAYLVRIAFRKLHCSLAPTWKREQTNNHAGNTIKHIFSL